MCAHITLGRGVAFGVPQAQVATDLHNPTCKANHPVNNNLHMRTQSCRRSIKLMRQSGIIIISGEACLESTHLQALHLHPYGPFVRLPISTSLHKLLPSHNERPVLVDNHCNRFRSLSFETRLVLQQLIRTGLFSTCEGVYL